MAVHCVEVGEGLSEAASGWSEESWAGSGKENYTSDEYYMLLTWNPKSTGIALKVNGKKNKIKLWKSLYYGFHTVQIAKHASMSCNKKCGDDYFFFFASLQLFCPGHVRNYIQIWWILEVKYEEKSNLLS